uniref:TIL domain-containing protein n=1 Tax=Cyclopterus lumpus TaxID=8103 RepID=A0A8C3A453_CYCLU
MKYIVTGKHPHIFSSLSLPSFHPSPPHAALACPPKSSYTLCASSCPETCLGVVGPPGCEDVCVEGCECNPGFILSNDKCVSLKDCGCVDTSGNYHPVSGHVNSITQSLESKH